MAIIKLGANAITALPAGVGKIVQVVQGASTAANTGLAPLSTPGTLTQLLPYTAVITPTSLSNKLMLHINIRYVNCGAFTGITDGHFWDDTGSAKFGVSHHYHYFGDLTHELQLEHQIWDATPPRTTSTTFKYEATIYRASGANTVGINNINESVRFTIMEYEESQ
jgi:hypothetical protein